MGTTVIRDGQIADDEWQWLADDGALPDSGRVIVTLERAQAADFAPADALEVGVLIPNTVDVEQLDGLDRWPLIALEFPSHADGRAYSQARVLRDRLGYGGELRATGDVLRDQIYYMRRCGFNSFQLAPGRDPEVALAGLEDFSQPYQPATDTAQTVFSRRATSS